MTQAQTHAPATTVDTGTSKAAESESDFESLLDRSMSRWDTLLDRLK